MDVVDAVAIFAAGIAAGGINTIVGSGSLITFPTMVALGFPPIVANVSNNIGLVPGNASGAYGYRKELEGQRARLLRLGSASGLGALIGVVLLLSLPDAAFTAIVVVLIAVALVLVVAQPRIQSWMAGRGGERRPDGGRWLWFGALATGVYGGYFGAAQGIVLIALMAIAIEDDLQRLNAGKNVMVAIVNGTAAVAFTVTWAFGGTRIDWLAVLLIAVGSSLGGILGAKLGRRIPALVLRGVIVVVGIVAIVNLLA
ncbi:MULTISPECIES: sulfite exporter TauE/SafE family protein [Actinomadura]|uniref:Probable membrane transporter protein n=1 Tax=Actinomadura yumaensis TaxID=111807 RepID=A0ABW2CRT4_9ACTN|nr:sulfite exporter TauE/SafE family protein [Actinomadura sp. J1-007]MWK35401.1 TSUP family transporter [Actinomadura sp. J1-007]